ncbi:MAG: type III-B CRISPR module RAMP protein Cmr1 [Thermoflexus sp.]|nr:type III-B CRISPR module RAMP protein Cmr1 [Thermoflexus sp.]
MQTLNVTLESVTPIFMGGADPRGRPELRAASFRGALRFWLRALLGATARGRELHELQRAESEVFGSTEKASPIIVIVRVREKLATVKFSDLIAQKKEEKREWPGIKYLFFAARETKKGELERQAISEGQQISLQIRPRPGWRNDEAMRRAYAALWLLSYFGGVGARWRRGAGGLQVTHVEGDISPDLPSLVVASFSPSELRDKIREGINKLADVFGILKSGMSPQFEALSPGNYKIVIINKTFTSWQEALDSFGQAMRDFRKRRPPEYHTIKNILQGISASSDPKVLRAAFGLPIPFYYRSLHKNNQPHYRGVVRGAQHDRRASPLIVRVMRLKSDQDSKFTILMMLIKNKLLPENENLILEYGGERDKTRQISKGEKEAKKKHRMSLPSDSEMEETLSLFFEYLREHVGETLEI